MLLINEELLQEASKDIALKFNIQSTSIRGLIGQIDADSSGDSSGPVKWIHEDWSTIMDLCSKHNVWVEKIILDGDIVQFNVYQSIMNDKVKLLCFKTESKTKSAEQYARMEGLLDFKII